MKYLLFLLLCVSPVLADKIITFGPGLVIVDSPIHITESNVIVQGYPSTVLKLRDGAQCPIIVVGDPNENIGYKIQRVTIKNLIIDGNWEYQESEYYARAPWLRNNCITIRGSENIYLKNVITTRARSGGVVTEKHSKHIIIEGLNSHDNYYDGFAACETTKLMMRSSILADNKYAGISLDWNCDFNDFHGILLRDNHDWGVYMRDSSFNLFRWITITWGGVYLDQRDDDIKSNCKDNYFFDINATRIFMGPTSKDNYFYLR